MKERCLRQRAKRSDHRGAGRSCFDARRPCWPPASSEAALLLAFHHALPHALKPIPQPRRLQQDRLLPVSRCRCPLPAPRGRDRQLGCLAPCAEVPGSDRCRPSGRESSHPSPGLRDWLRVLFQQVNPPKEPSNPLLAELEPFPGVPSVTVLRPGSPAGGQAAVSGSVPSGGHPPGPAHGRSAAARSLSLPRRPRYLGVKRVARVRPAPQLLGAHPLTLHRRVMCGAVKDTGSGGQGEQGGEDKGRTGHPAWAGDTSKC